MGDARFEDGSRAIIGCAFRVQNELGSGLLESAYQAALAIDFELEGIPSSAKRQFPCSIAAGPSVSPTVRTSCAVT